MRQTTFNKEQIEELLKNKNVARFSRKNITYTNDFKIRAVMQYLKEGTVPRGIFKQAGFDLGVLGKYKPKYLMYDWLKLYKKKGVDGLRVRANGSGRPKKSPPGSYKEKIKRLELEVVYLKRENDFLAKLRAEQSE